MFHECMKVHVDSFAGICLLNFVNELYIFVCAKIIARINQQRNHFIGISSCYSLNVSFYHIKVKKRKLSNYCFCQSVCYIKFCNFLESQAPGSWSLFDLVKNCTLSYCLTIWNINQMHYYYDVTPYYVDSYNFKT